MSRIVLVHGIGKQHKGPESLLSDWLPALRDGVLLAGGTPPESKSVSMAFYGDLFRPPGRALGEPDLDASDVVDPFDQSLLTAWWEAASAIDPTVPGPTAATRIRTPMAVQRALNALGHSRHLAGLSDRALIFDLSQVRRYFTEPSIREAVRGRVAGSVSSESRVMIAHSLGTVVAYEALCSHADWPIETLITLGSPLGVRNLIFDRLDPAPRGERGVWPGSVATWINIADRGDIVAVEKKLSILFGADVMDISVDNGSHAHDVRPYLTAKATGAAIRDSI